MRIVIDMQGVQTESRFRGIGRYTLSFAQAIVRNRGEHEVLLALSGLFPETIEPIRAAFDDQLQQENIRVWHAPGPVAEEYSDNDARREIAELIREAFLASLQPDIIHLSSLFEGYADDAVTSIGRFDQTTPVSVSLYDLIPLLNPEEYLKPNPRYQAYYDRKLDYLMRADTLLAISEFSQQEGVVHLDAVPERVVNVSTAIEDCFCPLELSEVNATTVMAKFNVTRPFILYTGGADERKNLPRLIQAYAALPAPLRASHQLLFAGKMPEGNITEFKHLAKSAGLKPNELCFTGYVTDEELMQLYNLCELYVFPSWYEGFTLSALEAMACRTAVIGANTTSQPEVIGLDTALFDPTDVIAITAKISQALQGDDFRATLRQHRLQQAKDFSWDETAKRALAAWNATKNHQDKQKTDKQLTERKPRLAFVSPLPPERTGIADYSAELLPEIAAYYDIELIVEQENIDTPWANKHPDRVHGAAWLRTHASEMDRVIYQIGNSPFHAFMLPLLRDIPGVVVLHDFYLSGLMSWLEDVAKIDRAWIDALYAAHGYEAVRERFSNPAATARKYSVNFDVLQHAQGLIVHSEYSLKLVRQWYGNNFNGRSVVIPHLRSPAEQLDKAAARKRLGIADDDFIVCSFGLLGETKLNHRLLDSWINSPLASDKKCHLIFVGENEGGAYGASLQKSIRSSGIKDRIRISGFASPELFRQYLMAADTTVQLRTHSRGETSGTVLDSMNYGLPLIVNANGSMADLDPEAVWMLPDEFDDTELTQALETLWREPKGRRTLGAYAQSIIHSRHAPAECAKLYAEEIENFHRRANSATPTLIQAIAAQKQEEGADNELIQIAKSISKTLPLPRPDKRLFLDVSVTCRGDFKTGIQRVVRALAISFLADPPAGYRIEPVYLCDAGEEWCYRYARRYSLSLLGCSPETLDDEIVEQESGDILLGLDFSGDITINADIAGLFTNYRNCGVAVYQIVYDLLPVRMPEVFPSGTDTHHARWLQVISKFDGAICISKAVADDLATWQKEAGLNLQGRRPYTIDWFHLGADIANSAPSRGMPKNAQQTLAQIKARPSFLMVGTIEPRKGYLQTIEAFTKLWSEGNDINLVIVGREGWKALPDDMCRDIPKTIERLRKHPELNKRLFWLDGISDEYLENVYAATTCLIASSYGEGFGLPLIEAAQHKLPIIARDIPVFREVAGESAFYFEDKTDSEILSKAVQCWLTLYYSNQHPQSGAMPLLTWRESTEQLLSILVTD